MQMCQNKLLILFLRLLFQDRLLELLDFFFAYTIPSIRLVFLEHLLRFFVLLLVVCHPIQDTNTSHEDLSSSS